MRSRTTKMAVALLSLTLVACSSGGGSEAGSPAPEPDPAPNIDLTSATIADPGGSISAPAYIDVANVVDYIDLSGGTVELDQCPLLTEGELLGDLSLEPGGTMKATVDSFNPIDDSDDPSILCQHPGLQFFIVNENHPVERAMRDMNRPELHWSPPSSFMGGKATMFCSDDNGQDKCGVLATLNGMSFVGREFIRGFTPQETADWFSDVMLEAVVLAP